MNRVQTLLQSRWMKPVKENSGVLASLILIAAVLSLVSPHFLTTSNIINVLLQISINAIVAFGMTYVILLGGIDLSVGAVMGMVGILSTSMLSKANWPLPLALVFGVAMGGVFGLFNGVVAVKGKIPAFIVTLATTNLAKGIGLVVCDGKPIYVDNPLFSYIGNGMLGGVLPLQIIYMLVIFLILLVILNYTRYGKHIYATGGNDEAARFSGIAVDKIKIISFTICGLMAGVGGVLSSAKLYSGQPSMGQGAELDAIAAVVLGGTVMTGGAGTLGGTLIGALIIGIINNGLNLLGVNMYWQYVAKGTIILIAVWVDVFKNKRRK